MANAIRPSGLAPVQYFNGNPWSGQAHTYSIAASYATALAIGDPVTYSGTSDANGVPGIVIATAGTGNAILGVIVGLGKYEGNMVNPNNLDQIIRPASDPAVWYAMVADDPDIVFEVADVNSGTAIPITAIGNNINLSAGAGNNGYVSGWVLDNTSIGTGSTIQMKILGAVRRPDNQIGVAGAKFLCVINNHVRSGGTTGI